MPVSRHRRSANRPPLFLVDETTWEYALAAWATALRAGGKPDTTIRTRRQHINQLRTETAVPSPWALDTDALMGWLGDHEWKLSSLRSARTSLRSFYSWAHEAGYVASDPSLRLPTVRQPPPAPHPTPDDILADLLGKVAPRERLMILLAARCGLRRGEVARVHTRDVFLGHGGWSLRVHGKGGKERVVPVPNDLARSLLDGPPGFVFPGQDNGHLSPLWVGQLISRLMPPGWSMHSLRHRFASRAYQATGDLLSVQQLLGHASPAVTQVYVQVADDKVRAAMLAAA